MLFLARPRTARQCPVKLTDCPAEGPQALHKSTELSTSRSFARISETMFRQASVIVVFVMLAGHAYAAAHEESPVEESPVEESSPVRNNQNHRNNQNQHQAYSPVPSETRPAQTSVVDFLFSTLALSDSVRLTTSYKQRFSH